MDVMKFVSIEGRRYMANIVDYSKNDTTNEELPMRLTCQLVQKRGSFARFVLCAIPAVCVTSVAAAVLLELVYERAIRTMSATLI
jgi:hypothetical protein